MFAYVLTLTGNACIGMDTLAVIRKHAHRYSHRCLPRPWWSRFHGYGQTGVPSDSSLNRLLDELRMLVSIEAQEPLLLSMLPAECGREPRTGRRKCVSLGVQGLPTNSAISGSSSSSGVAHVREARRESTLGLMKSCGSRRSRGTKRAWASYRPAPPGQGFHDCRCA